MERHETISLLAALKTLDPRNFIAIDEPTIAVWHSVLNREPAIPAVDAMRTAYELVATPGATFPTPGDFRALVAETVSGLPSVADARAQVERALKENYPGMTARYTPDALVLRAVRSIGGVAVFRASQSEQETSRLWRAFETAYRTMRDEVVNRPALPSPSEPALSGEVAS